MLPGSTPAKTPVVEMVVAGLILSAGTAAMIVSIVVGGTGGGGGGGGDARSGDQAWTVVGSSMMGLGSLLMVVGVCWYLAKTSHLSDGAGGGPNEIGLNGGAGQLHEVRVDAVQLQSLVQRGYEVHDPSATSTAAAALTTSTFVTRQTPF